MVEERVEEEGMFGGVVWRGCFDGDDRQRHCHE